MSRTLTYYKRSQHSLIGKRSFFWILVKVWRYKREDIRVFVGKVTQYNLLKKT